jgi:hypothetical protein
MKRKSTNHKSVKLPAFAQRAERAFRRVAKKVRAQTRAMKLPLLVWPDGKTAKKRS